jgi:hypothetical protein
LLNWRNLKPVAIPAQLRAIFIDVVQTPAIWSNVGAHHFG